MTQLYRHFDGDGVLLYVGITRKIGWRLLAHERNAGWWRDVRRIDVVTLVRPVDRCLARQRACLSVFVRGRSPSRGRPIEPSI